MQRKQGFILFAIVMTAVCAFFYQGKQKLRLHEDEVMTYWLANSQEEEYFTAPLMEQQDAGELYMKAMTVHADSRFDYATVWKNQANDVHPPLYYAVIHTICSFMPDTYSIWIGLYVNLIFFILNIFLIYNCGLLLFKNNCLALAVTAFFAICPGMLEVAVFIRMYMMSIFFCLLMLRWFLKHLEEEVTPIAAYPVLFIPVVLGALTHYYCVLFVVLYSVAYCLWQMKRKYWRKLIVYCTTMALSAVTAILIFPAMLSHVFTGYRGTEAFGNVLAANDVLYRYYKFIRIVNNDIFGGCLLLLWIIVMMGVRKKGDSAKELMKTQRGRRMRFVLAPALVYFIIVAKTAAYLDIRYISLIFPSLILCGIGAILILINRYFNETKTTGISIVVILFLILGSYLLCDWSYSYKDNQPILDTVKQYSDNDCIFIFDDGLWMTSKGFQELELYNSTTFVQADDVSQLPTTVTGQEDGFVVYVSLFTDPQSMVNRVLQYCDQVNTYEELYTWRYVHTYYFYNK